MFLKRGVVGLMVDESPSALPVVSVASPVTWHVVVWILITLAINSMAQPSGRICGIPDRYRLYLSSSPILCAVDAFSAIIRLITTSICFRISPQKACHLVAVSRFEVDLGTYKDYSLSTSLTPPPPPKPHSGPMSNSWPHYLFFVMGTLPAAIKLASFTGNPWTKTWGFMFLASFTIIEIVSLLSRRHGGVTFSLVTDPYVGALNWSVPAVLDLSWEEWLGPQNKNLHTKTASLRFWLKISDSILFVSAFIIHVIVLGWALLMIWRPAAKVLDTSHILKIVSFIVLDIALVALIALIVVWIGMCCTGYNTEGSFLIRVLSWWSTAFMIWLVISPHEDPWQHKSDNSYTQLNHIMAVAIAPCFCLWVTYSIGYRIMDWVGRRWPTVTKALLVKQTGWEQVKEPTEQVTSARLLNKADDKKPEVPVNEAAFFSLFFFLTNLGICLGWYAIKYNPIGTVNPAWTDIFGRK